MKKIAFLIFGLLLLHNYSNSQGLKRRATLGIYGTEISDSLSGVSSIQIDSLLSQNFSEKHHLRVHDILLNMNDSKTKSMRELGMLVANYRAGDEVRFEIIRKGQKKEVAGVFPAFPFETSEQHDIIYDNFEFDDGYIRTIIDKPKGNKKFPAIFFIQGYTCSSIDNVRMHPYIQLAKGLCEKGYVVMRMEKPGTGDCNNKTRCSDLDFNTEKDAFLKGLRKLKSYDFVDTSKVFIWGHSMGGIIAPIIANKEKVRGIIVYGTTINPWREYLLETFRVQYPLFGVDYVELEDHMLDYYKVIHELFVEKKEPSVIAKDSVFSNILRDQFSYDGNERIYGRNYKSFVQIDDYNMYKYWSQINAHVLVFWADADIEAFSSFEHKTIVDVVNHYHPGKAKFIHLDNTTHAFAKVKSMQDGLANRNWSYITTHFNEDVVNKTNQWIMSINNHKEF